MGLFKYSSNDTGLGSESWPVLSQFFSIVSLVPDFLFQWPYTVSATIPYVGRYVVLVLYFHLSLWLVPVGLVLCLHRTDLSNISTSVWTEGTLKENAKDSIIDLLLLLLIYLYKCFVCMSVNAWLTVEARRVCQNSWNWNYRWSWTAMWMLGIVPGSSGRARLLTTEPSLWPQHCFILLRLILSMFWRPAPC